MKGLTFALLWATCWAIVCGLWCIDYLTKSQWVSAAFQGGCVLFQTIWACYFYKELKKKDEQHENH